MIFVSECTISILLQRCEETREPERCEDRDSIQPTPKDLWDPLSHQASLEGIWVSAILNELPPEYSGGHGKLQDWVFSIGESTGRRTEILGFNANDISGSLLLPGTTMKV